MPVRVDNGVAGQFARTSTPITINDFPARLLLVWVYYVFDSVYDKTVSITWDGVAMTFESWHAQQLNRGLSLWYLADPHMGNNTLIVDDRSSAGQIVLAIDALYGVNAAAPITESTGSSGFGGTVSPSLNAESLVVDCFIDNVPVMWHSGTLIASGDAGGWHVNTSWMQGTGGNDTLSWSDAGGGDKTWVGMSVNTPNPIGASAALTPVLAH